ncbi:MAG: hypothetical protein K6G88_11280 [Lachnospiraceae bacterium]|nr:hypothetical protein [Lachnospiraceae bacterium]
MDSKFNFVFEGLNEEDEKFLEKIKIIRVYHGGEARMPRHWTADREKGMFLIYNDSPGSLVLDGINGPDVNSFIYKNVVSEIHYRYEYDNSNSNYSLMIEKYYVNRELRDEEQYVMDAMRKALIEDLRGLHGSCKLVSDNLLNN